LRDLQRGLELGVGATRDAHHFLQQNVVVLIRELAGLPSALASFRSTVS
jgi:hypothetical protein